MTDSISASRHYKGLTSLVVVVEHQVLSQCITAQTERNIAVDRRLGHLLVKVYAHSLSQEWTR